MKKLQVLILICLGVLAFPNTAVHATSWEEFKPETVVNRADVVVKGTYDFLSKPKPSSFIFVGYTFNITAVYKGDPSNPVIAGIDGFDVGWAEEFQEDGGEFLLFLEEDETNDFLVPVAGPNGMITMKNGKIDHPVQEKENFYNDFLNSNQPRKASVKSTTTTTDSPSQQRAERGLYLSVVAVFGMLVFWGVRRITRH